MTIGESVPHYVPPEHEKSGFFRWPTPKALAFWLVLLGAVTAIGIPIASAFFVRAEIYNVDKSAQQVINTKVEEAQKNVTVQITDLKKQMDEQRSEQRQENRDINSKLDTLLQRRIR